jgi:acetyltransferase-like isoleucine patch superfamily enzyme
MKLIIKEYIIRSMSLFLKLFLYFFNSLRIASIVSMLRLSLWKAKKLRIGDGVTIRGNVIIRSPERVELGSRVVLNEFVHIWGEGGVSIGNNSIIASHTVITSQTHSIGNGLYLDTLLCKKVVIGENVWIGAGSIILPGVIIGDNCVIGAGSVVTRNVPENTVSVGVPAKVLRSVL